MKNDKQQVDNSENIDGVQISDSDLEQADSLKNQDKKAAKKRAKQLRTPEEKKKLKRRKTLISVGIILAIIIAIFAIPFSRWPVLNLLGFRGSVEVLVQEQSSNETVSGVNVTLDSVVVGSTDPSGQLTLSNIKLGEHSLRLEKAGYSREIQNVVVGYGTTKLDYSIEAIGLKINFNIKNWLTGKPVAKAQLVSGDRKSTTDQKGQAALVVSPTEEQTTVNVSAKGYITRKVKIDPKVVSSEVALVSSAKNYFISKRDGNYDIFSSNIDGTNQKKIIEATGKEDKNFLQFTIHSSSNNWAILVATREGKRLNNRIVAGVYKVDLAKATIAKIDEGSDIRILDWAGDNLVYTKTQPELKYDDKNFARIMSFNVKTGALTQRAQANYFQLNAVVGSSLFYMPADAYREIKEANLTSIELASGAKNTYLKDRQINYGTQTAYGILQLETYDGQNYEINSLNKSTIKIDRQPSSTKSFALSSNAKKVIHADRRDGKGALLVEALKDSKENVVVKIGGLSQPVRWVNGSLVVVRVATSQETADYVVDTASGKFAKITDVSNVGLGPT
jgi:hypothetical protein